MDEDKEPAKYRRLAQELRAEATGKQDANIRRSMLFIAERYDKLANAIEGLAYAEAHKL